MAERLNWFRDVVRVLFRVVRNDMAPIGFGYFQVASAASCPALCRASHVKDVDGRDEPGHDDLNCAASPPSCPALCRASTAFFAAETENSLVFLAPVPANDGFRNAVGGREIRLDVDKPRAVQAIQSDDRKPITVDAQQLDDAHRHRIWP